MHRKTTSASFSLDGLNFPYSLKKAGAGTAKKFFGWARITYHKLPLLSNLNRLQSFGIFLLIGINLTPIFSPVAIASSLKQTNQPLSDLAKLIEANTAPNPNSTTPDPVISNEFSPIPKTTKAVKPVLEDIKPNPDGTYVASFGYSNENSMEVTILIGDKNYFHPKPIDRGQITQFKPGRIQNAFSIIMECSQTLVWTLTSPNGSRRTSTATTPKCSSSSSSFSSQSQASSESSSSQSTSSSAISSSQSESISSQASSQSSSQSQPTSSSRSSSSSQSSESEIDPIYDPIGPFPDEEISCANPYGWVEIREKRTQTTKTYRVNESKDGVEETKTIVCSFTDHIHYQDESTQFWEDIDNRIIRLDENTEERQKGYTYRSKANDFKVYFGNTTKDGFWFFSKELDYKIDTITFGQSKIAPSKARVRNNIITYQEIVPGIDLEYTIYSTGVAKRFILKNHDALKQDLKEIHFHYRSNKKLENKQSAGIGFEGVDSFFIPTPTTTDIRGVEVSFDQYQIDSSANQFIIKPDQEFLYSKDRAFPIIIDPGTMRASLVQDTFVSDTTGATPQGGISPRKPLVVGDYYDPVPNRVYDDAIAYLEFSKAPGNVVDARLQVYNYGTSEYWYQGGQIRTIPKDFTADITRLNGSFNENTTVKNEKENEKNKAPFPTLEGDYGDLFFPGMIQQNRTLLRVSSDISDLVNSYGSGNVKIGLRERNTTRQGAVFCSKEWDDPHCIGKLPILQYTLNNAPTPPKAETPDGNEFIGNCDLSQIPATGLCTGTLGIKFIVSNINGGDNDKGAYNLELLNEVTDPGFWYERAGFKGWFLGKDNRTEQIWNGIYDWASRNKDNFGETSDRSGSKSLVVDTQPPIQMEPLSIPDSVKGQVEFDIPQFRDNILHKIQFTIKGTDLAIQASGNGPGSLVYIAKSTGGTSQQWSLEANGLIRGIGDKCLEYDLATSKVSLQTCDGGANQRWEYSANQELRARGLDTCLDGKNLQVGVSLYLFNCHGGNNQAFETIDLSKKRIRLINSDKSIDFAGTVKDNAETAHLWTAHSDINQQWQLIATNPLDPKNQTFLIRGRGNRCLDAPSTSIDTRIHGWTCNVQNTNQYWILSGRQIKLAKKPQLCLEAKNGPTNGSPLIIRTCSLTQPNQNFVVESSFALKNPTFALSYFVQVAGTEDFTPDSILYQGWQSSPQFQLACIYDETGFIIPEDKLDETTQIPRKCLENGKTYFVRVKAKDRQHSLDPKAKNNGNISKWTDVTTFLVDSSIPVVKNSQVSVSRISPSNPTSVGVADSTVLSFDFSAKNFQKAEVIVKNSKQEVVATLNQCRQAQDGPAIFCDSQNLDYPYNPDLPNTDPGNFKTIWFEFNGKSTDGSALPDGAYTLIPKVSNNANITNDLGKANHSSLIIDNSGASISISKPKTETIVQNQAVEISGQVAGFNQTGKEDKDIQRLEIRKIDADQDEQNSTGFDWKEVDLGVEVETSPGKMEMDSSLFRISENLDLGLNIFEFRTTDSVGNQITAIGDPSDQTPDPEKLEILVDTQKPEFTEINPRGILEPKTTFPDPKNPGKTLTQYQPTIEFRFKDNALVQFSKNLKATQFQNYDLSILYSPNGTDQWIEEPIFKNGVDVSAGILKIKNNNGCALIQETQPEANNSTFSSLTCSLILENVSQSGFYRPVIRVKDVAGNAICNTNPSQFGSSETDFDCKDTIQAKTENFDPEAQFQIPGTDNQNQKVEITSPKDGFTTNRSILNVVGTAPKSSDGEIWKVKICVDSLTTPNTNTCDQFTEINASSDGSFASILPLPQIANRHRIWAIATNSKTNTQTEPSNAVTVKINVADPFKDARVIPSFYGVNTKEDIDKFIKGELTIQDLRTLQTRSRVTENTEAVDLDFADYSGLSRLPNTDPQTGYSTVYNPKNRVASLNQNQETEYKWNPWQDPDLKKDWSKEFANGKDIEPQRVCQPNTQAGSTSEDSCLWIYNYPTPFWIGGGLYEIRFRGYKNQIVQDLTRSVAVTNQLVAAPRILRVEKSLDHGNANQNWQIARQIQSNFYSNSPSLKFVGVADPGATITFKIQNKTFTAKTAQSGLWTLEADLDAKDGNYPINLTASLENQATDSIENYALSLDTTLPKLLGVQTMNLSNSRAINPWLMTGDQIRFLIQTDEPINTGSVFGELGFREDLFKVVGGVKTRDDCHLALNCSAKELATTEFLGDLTILRPLGGMYFPYIKLEDQAGNQVFYANNPNIQNINIDPFDTIECTPGNSNPNLPCDQESSIPKIYLDPNITAFGNDIDTTISNYPYSTDSRLSSLDFRLFIDNIKPEKKELIIDGWGNRLSGRYAGKKLQEGQTATYIPDPDDEFEADRLLTDRSYFNNLSCEVDTTKPGKETFWNLYDPNQTKTPKGCPVSPGYVIKGNQLTVTGYGEQHQRVVVTVGMGSSDESGKQTKYDTIYHELEVPNSECIDYSTHPQLYPPLEQAASNQENGGVDPGNPIPGIHVNNIERGNIVTKFATLCKWSFTQELKDGGESPNGVPKNWYRFSFHLEDLAGNTPVATNNDEMGDNGQSSATSPINPIPGATIESRSVLVYHDTDDPDDYVIHNMEDKDHDPVIDFGKDPQSNIREGAITKENTIKVQGYGERAADVEFKLKQNKHPEAAQVAGNTGNTSLKNYLTINTDKDSTPGPDNIISKDVRLIQNGYDGKVTTDLKLGAKKVNSGNAGGDDGGSNSGNTSGGNTSPGTESLVAADTSRDEDGKAEGSGGSGTGDGNGTSTQDCVVLSNSPIVNRRIGVCNDGIYDVEMRMTDTAGNVGDEGSAGGNGNSGNSSGGWVRKSVERDTVNPGRPNVSVFSSPSQIGIFERLGLEITGEGGTTAKIEVKSSSGFSKSRYAYLGFSGKYRSSDLLGSELSCGAITYTVTVRLVDRAGNVGEEASSTLTTKPCPVCGGSGNGMFAHPLAGKGKLSSNYPIRAIQGYYNAPHAGLDFSTTSGTPVYAAYDGTVKTADHSHANHIDTDEGWGNVVILVHEIEGIKHQTVYAHLNQTRAVNVGDTVKRGQLIGYSGNSGNSTGPHLHFQVEKQGAPLNPKIAAGGIVRWNMAYPVDPKGYLESMESNLSSEQQDYYCPDTEKVDLRSGEENGDDSNPDLPIPTAEEIRNGQYELQQVDRSFNEVADEFTNTISNDVQGALDGLVSLTPASLATCLAKGATKLPDYQKAFQEFMSCAKIENIMLAIHLLWGLAQGGAQWVAEIFTDVWDVIQALKGKSFDKALQFLWGKLKDKSLWVNVGDFLRKMFTSPEFYFLLSLNAPTLLSNGPGGVLIGSLVTIGEYAYLANKEAADSWVMNLAIAVMEDLLSKSKEERLELIGKIAGYLSLEVVTTFVSFGVVPAAKRLIKGLGVVAKEVKYIETVVELVGEMGGGLWRASNRLGRLINKSVSIGKISFTVRVLADGALGIVGGDMYDIIKAVSHSDDLLPLTEVMVDANKKRNVISFGWITHSCPVNSIDVSAISPSNSGTNKFLALLTGPRVEAASGKSFVCKLLNHPLSHWRERHFEISDTDLQKRAIIKAKSGNGIASKFTISEDEVNDLIDNKLKSAEGEALIKVLKSIPPKSRRELEFEVDKVVGYGYQVPVDNNGLNKVTNLDKIKVVFVKSDEGDLYILTTFPTK